MKKYHPPAIQFMTVALILIALFLLFSAFITVSESADVPLTLSWDAGASDASMTDWEKINVYTRLEGADYDYNSPFAVINQSYTEDGLSTPVVSDRFVFNYPDSDEPVSEATRYFVIRSAAGDKESVDSNEASYTINNARPAKIPDLVAVYNQAINAIDFTWSPIPDDRITMYLVAISDADDGDFCEVAEIDASANSASITNSDVYPDGEITTRFWAVESVTGFNIHSGWSNVVKITVDRRSLDPPKTLRVILN